MIVKVYIKGTFKGNYRALPAGGNADLLRTYRHINFKDKWLFEAEKTEPYYKQLLTKEPYYESELIKDVYVSMKGDQKDVFFQEDFTDVVINDIVIFKSDATKDEATLKGNFYGTLIINKPDPPKEALKVNAPVKPLNKKTQVNTGDSVVSDEEEIVADTVFHKPWQPDDFLSNYGIKTNDWQSWKERWHGKWIKLALCLLGMLFIVKSGLLSIPLMWIPFLLLAKITGDELLRIISPSTALRQSAAALNVNSGRRTLRNLYLFILVILCLFFIYKKLILFAVIAGALALLHLFTYGSPLIFSFRRLFQVAGLLLILFALLRVFEKANDTTPIPQTTDADDSELIPDKPDSAGLRNQYTLTWEDYRKNVYKGTYAVSKNNYSLSFKNRVAQNPVRGIEEVYSGVYQVDKRLVSGIIQMFEKIKKEKNLNPVQFAEMAGTFVQRIPYVLVHDLSCAQLIRENYNDKFIQQYHRDGGQCLQNCKFGLQAPTEFTYNLKGDCDTRTLMLFTILDHFGYDVAILISNAYGHSIFGIGLPYQGLYKSYGGVRYFAWELTAPGWQPGLLPPQISDMDNWEIALINK